MNEIKKRLEELRDKAISVNYNEEAMTIQDALTEIKDLEDEVKKTKMELKVREENDERNDR